MKNKVQHTVHESLEILTNLKENTVCTILTDSNFQKEVLENSEPVLVEFGADWCGSCYILAPIMEELAVDFNGQIKIAKLDIDDNQRVAEIFGIRVPPTLLFFKNGQVVDHIIGAAPKALIEDKFNALLIKST